MNRRDFSKMIVAAVGGIVAGGALVGCGGDGDKHENSGVEKHVCKGMNTCKGKGGCHTDKNSCGGKNECSGKGGCATVKHSCKTKNECKGQGGCKTDKNACKGKNECTGKGGCASPVKS